MLVHHCRYRILYRDTDSMGVLYYGRFLALFELGRVEWLRSEGLRYRDFEDQHAMILPVSEALCRYYAPMRYDDEARIETWVAAWSPSTLRFGHRILSGDDGRRCAAGQVELACVLAENHRPVRLPAVLTEMLQRTAADRKGRILPQEFEEID